MLQTLSKEIRERLRQKEECKRLSQAAQTETSPVQPKPPGQTITTVSGERIKDAPAFTVEELLQESPGGPITPSVIVLLTALSAMYDPASWTLGTFDTLQTKLYRRDHAPAARLSLPFRPTKLEQDNGTGRIEVAEHRYR